MIIQENDFLKTYNEMNELWEDAEIPLESTKVSVEIKGQVHEIETPFMTLDEFRSKMYRIPGIYIWKRLPYVDRPEPAYYVGKAMNIHRRTNEHVTARHGDSVALHAALRKHRICDTDTQHSQFEIAILEFCEKNDAILKSREIEWITKLGTFTNRDDYNLTRGGDSGGNPKGKDPKVTIEMFEEIVDHLQDNKLTIQTIAALYKVSDTTISNLNENKFAYVERFAQELNLNLTFPIRSTEEAHKIGNMAKSVKVINKQLDKYWALTLIQNDWADETHTKVVQVATENLGIYAGKVAAWAKICELERSRFKTENTEAQIKKEEEKPSRNSTLVQGNYVGFDLLRAPRPGRKPNDARYKRKYVVTRVDAPADDMIDEN